MAKDERIALRLDAATKVALAKAAAADKRSLSAMVENYIVERLRADGWLKAEGRRVTSYRRVTASAKR